MFKITKNMSFFPPQACCLFLLITSASQKYFLEGSRVSAELKVPQWSDFSFSVFRAPHDQHCPATLGNKSRHTCLRQAPKDKASWIEAQRPEGWKLYLSLWFPRGSTAELSSLTNRPCRRTLATVQSMHLQRGGRKPLLDRYTYILLDGLKNRCQGN